MSITPATPLPSYVTVPGGDGSQSSPPKLSEAASTLSDSQQDAAQKILQSSTPQNTIDSQLLEQKEFIRSHAEDLKKLISESLVELLKVSPSLQAKLEIKLEKGQTININEMFKKINNVFLQDKKDKTANLDSEEDFEWVTDENIAQLKQIYDEYRIFLKQFDEDIQHKQCSKLLAELLEDDLKKAIDKSLKDQFSVVQVLKKGIPVLGAVWAVRRVAMKISNMGGFTLITNAFS